MIFSPTKEEYFSLFHILGRIIVLLGCMFLVPAVIAWFLKEENPGFNFILSFLITESAGLLLMAAFPQRKELNYSLTFLLVSAIWIIVPLFGALPLWMSGHFNSFLGAFFDSMSGFSTTGLSVIQSLDTVSFSVNFWRHFMMFLGGQGIIIAALSFAATAASSGLGLYAGEAREEKILPNIFSTVRFIWLVSIVYFLLGSTALFFLSRHSGLPLKKALFHSAFLFMAAFDTGGFTPQSMSIFYYHSIAIETATVVFMLLGSLNFNLHYCLWRKKRAEIFKNIETRTFFLSMTFLFVFLSAGLLFSLRFSFGEFFRKVFYQLVTAHTGCGFSNISVRELAGWPKLALIPLILAMALGGGVGSTTGGIKMMRFALLMKAVKSEIKSWIFPARVKIYEKYHHIQDLVLEDKRIRLVFVVFLFYIFSYFAGAVVGMFYGHSFLSSLFESVSACANVGLSLGITSAAMPAGLKITYIIQMWAGRLEFISIIVSLGLIFSAFKK